MKHISDASSDYVRDSADYAEQAASRWHHYEPRFLIAVSLEKAKQMSDDAPEEEFAGLLVLRADWWFDPAQPVAFAYFRRTWSGSIFLEFMAGHPLAEGNITGILRATLSILTHVAQATGGDWIWWEATKDSFPKYESIIGDQNFLSGTSPRIKDVFAVRTTSLEGLLSRDKGAKKTP